MIVAVPEGRQTRYELADEKLRLALSDLLGVVLAVDTAEPCVEQTPGVGCVAEAGARDRHSYPRV